MVYVSINRPPIPLPYQDFAKLTDEEMAATVTDGAVNVQEAHSTFVPHNHPFAHARLLNVVCRVASLDKTTKFYESLGFINLRERTTQDYSAVVMGFGYVCSGVEGVGCVCVGGVALVVGRWDRGVDWVEPLCG